MLKITSYILGIIFICIPLIHSQKLGKKKHSFSKQIAKTNPNSINASSQGLVTPSFINSQGSNTTEAEMAQFRRLVNSSGYFHFDNPDGRVTFISEKMEEAFNRRYSIFMLRNPSNWDISIIQKNKVWGSLGKGFDGLFPNNSYMFVKDFQDYRDDHLQKLNRVGQKGSYIDQEIQEVFGNIIWAVERFDQNCDCYRSANSIRQYINRFIGNIDWNVMCSSELNFNTAVWVYYQSYLVTKQKCYYIIYDD